MIPGMIIYSESNGVSFYKDPNHKSDLIAQMGSAFIKTLNITNLHIKR
ncbi:hypothetical protein PL9631_660133 [Planktothrix paucivesiculata PCC 9631]|uniref:Uncharacterized protein n=1 Tax=Planktothrix paucivesiculata PCC 9631 TaxID=671071 RepID=A0A7Z9E1M2_9CYAN|nr:hypothetical protein PL9631_660133 [Planktothrix paucivesiculata PCC 9631]